LVKLGGVKGQATRLTRFNPLTHIHTDHGGGLVEAVNGVSCRHALSASQMSISGSIERMPRDSTLLKVL